MPNQVMDWAHIQLKVLANAQRFCHMEIPQGMKSKLTLCGINMMRWESTSRL